MKKNYFILLAIFVFSIKINAQCAGCTINIIGLDASPHIVNSGQIFCIAPTGTVTGQITVSAGGTLCNQGTINSFNLWIAGGTLKNYGTINTNNVLVSTAGTYTNYATSIIDSLLVQNLASSYVNNGTQTSDAFGIADNGTVLNTGTISCALMADSIGNFTNNGTIDITGPGFSNAYSSNFINNGNLTITTDFANSNSSNFTNNNYMNVGRDLFNASNSNFTTKCMMNVGRDWYNSASVYGSGLASCGGINIAGISYNTGNIGSASTHVDICDAGNPIGGLDGNIGTINPTTTYCTCTNNCVIVTGIKEAIKESSTLINTVFPNPSSHKIIVKFNSQQSESLFIEIKDMVGKIILTKTHQSLTGENETDFNISGLAQGIYILSITDSHQLQSKRLFSVVK